MEIGRNCPKLSALSCSLGRYTPSALHQSLTISLSFYRSRNADFLCNISSCLCGFNHLSFLLCLNDYRPVALTSIVMKCFEKLVPRRLLTFTNKHLDPLQFAYKRHRGTDDAILTVLHNAFLHLDKAGSYVRILFIDFSFAFNTIQPHLLALKLLHLDVNPKLILWIVNFLLHRSQSVRFQNSLSSQRHTCTGAPQGTVLSPALFTLYTNDCQGTTKTTIVKYSDDTAIEDLSNSDSVYFSEVHKFSAWCKENYLDLNIVKTKEMVVDFRNHS